MPFQTIGGVIAPTSRTCANCDLRASCKFDSPKVGGFKGEGPKHIGYRIITDRTEQNGAKEDFCSCFVFVEALQRRMTIGRQLRDDGKDGEIIRVIAQEGETIKRRIRVGMNAKGEIVRPNAEIIPDLKASGHKISTGGAAELPFEWQDVTFNVVVPSYQVWANRLTGYVDDIMRTELETEQQADAFEDEAWRQAEARQVAKAEPAKAAR